MLENFYGWVKTIAACLLFMSLVLRLLPEGENVKYIRYFMGMLLILVVLAPLGRIFRIEKAFSQMEHFFEQMGSRADFKEELLLMGDEYTEAVVRGYEEELADKALILLGKEGYGEYSVKVTIEDDMDLETFGQVEKLELRPFQNKENENETGRIVIEKRKVQILSEEPAEKNYLQEAEDGQLKKILSAEFSIPEEAVFIVR